MLQMRYCIRLSEVNLLEKEELLKLIATKEDDRHDFKEQWYEPGQGNSDKAEMLKDIFSFVNTVHNEDCYLIFGIADGTHEVVGVENSKHRYNTQQITDWLSKLPIEPEIPEIRIDTFHIQEHEVDVMVIQNTDNVPVFLSDEQKGKGFGKHSIHPGQVFTRREDTNTPISRTANYNQLVELLKKHLGLNLPIKGRFKKVLKDWKNWNYYEHTGEVGLQYEIDPAFKIVFVEKSSNIKADTFSLSQIRADIDWEDALLTHNNNTIKEISVVNLDGGRFKAVVPDKGTISYFGENLFYDCYRENSLKYHLEELINNLHSPISPDRGSFEKLMGAIVLYRNADYQHEVERGLEKIWKSIDASTNPSSEEIDMYRHKLESDLPSGSDELSDVAVQNMVKQMKTTKYVKTFLTQNQT